MTRLKYEGHYIFFIKLQFTDIFFRKNNVKPEMFQLTDDCDFKILRHQDYFLRRN